MCDNTIVSGIALDIKKKRINSAIKRLMVFKIKVFVKFKNASTKQKRISGQGGICESWPQKNSHN